MNIARGKSTSAEYHELSGLLNIISAVLFFMFVLLKPYYMRPSGLIGAADLCLALSGSVMLISCLVAYARQKVGQAELVADRAMAIDDKTLQGANTALKEKAQLAETGTNTAALKEKAQFATAGTNHAALNENAQLSVAGLSNAHSMAEALLYRQDIALYLFLICVAVINGVYAYRLGSNEYIKYTLYWAYNIFAIWTYRRLSDGNINLTLHRRKMSAVIPSSGIGASERTHADTCVTGTATSTATSQGQGINKTASISFEQLVSFALEADIFIQLFIMLGGYGRIFTEYWDEGAIRYMGSFNDPNQLAFFTFAALLLVFSINAGRRTAKGHFADKIHLSAVTVAAVLIIIKTKSTGIMLGLMIFVSLLMCCALFNAYRQGRISQRQIALIIVTGVLITVALVYLVMPPADFDVHVTEYNIFTRIQEKLWKLSQGGIIGFFIDRGADRIVTHPEYMLFGAGEGGFARFMTLDGKVNELHSSLLSILFCYGIVPTLLICKWCIDALKKKNMWQLCAACALILESMTLINYRQPLFWFLLM